jgi:hypothetical protein
LEGEADDQLSHRCVAQQGAQPQGANRPRTEGAASVIETWIAKGDAMIEFLFWLFGFVCGIGATVLAAMVRVSSHEPTVLDPRGVSPLDMPTS